MEWIQQYVATQAKHIMDTHPEQTVKETAPAKEGEPWRVKVVLEFPRDTDPFLKSTVKAAEAAIKYHCKKEAGDVSTTLDMTGRGRYST